MSKAERKRDAENRLPRITKTCKVVLAANDGTRYPIGEFTLTEIEPGPTVEQFADAGFRSARASLNRLMTPQYRIVIIDGAKETGFGLDHWIKLVDGQAEELRRQAGKGPKQRIHRR